MGRIITIGREFGSGGREIGTRLAEALKIAYYDSEIVTKIAQKTDLAEEYVHQILERSPVTFLPITIGQTFYPMSDPQLEQSNSVYYEQHNIIREMAEKSDCVIVGRCADYILRDKHPLRVFVYASSEFKFKRCREKAPEGESMSDRELRRHIKAVDRERAQYYQFITGQKWGNPLNYDVCINTTESPIKEIVAGLVKMCE